MTGIQFAQTVQGIQSSGVIACGKHYIGNEQEHFRQVAEADGLYGYNISNSASSNIDDRTLHELYLWPFADAVRAGVGSIMCSYNQVSTKFPCNLVYPLIVFEGQQQLRLPKQLHSKLLIEGGAWFPGIRYERLERTTLWC